MQFSLRNIYFFIAYDFTIDINATEKDKHQFKIKKTSEKTLKRNCTYEHWEMACNSAVTDLNQIYDNQTFEQHTSFARRCTKEDHKNTRSSLVDVWFFMRLNCQRMVFLSSNTKKKNNNN